MNIEIDWDRVIEVEPNIEDNGLHTIAFVFDDYTVCTYGYSDSKLFIKDYARLMEESNKC